MYLKKNIKTVVISNLPLEKGGKKQLELQSLKVCDKTGDVQDWNLRRFCFGVLQMLEQISFSLSAAMDSRFSRTGPVTHKSLSSWGRNSGGSYFSLLDFGIEDLAVRKLTTEHALPPALLLEIRKPAFLSRLMQTDHTIQSELRPVPPDC